MICKRLTILVLRRTPCWASSTAFIMGSVPKNCLTCYLPNCVTAQYATSLNIIQTTWIRGTLIFGGFVSTFFHAPRECGITYPRQRFQIDMTWVPFSISTLKAGNAPVAPLVLHGVMGGGDHLSSGNPNTRFPCLFYKKKQFESKLDVPRSSHCTE